ncbi:MAG: hypothetical protein ACLRIO_05805, partial [Butyricicoccus sp.]
VDIAPEDWERNMDALEDIYALCRRNNIQLVLYRAPTKRLHDADWGRLTAQFDGRDGVSTLNCSDYTAQIAADPETTSTTHCITTVSVRRNSVHFSRTGRRTISRSRRMNRRIPCCGRHACSISAI